MSNDEQLRQMRETQRAQVREIADYLRDGKPLTKRQAQLAAGLLYVAAERLLVEPSPPPGRPPKIPDDACWNFVSRTRNGEGKNKVIADLAQQYEVSVEAIKKKIGNTGTAESKALAEDKMRIVSDFFGPEEN
ncbi:hypothetical protein [Pseudomonas sp. 2FE]|uniref:hypothetical protein n=1 Tax=Pseudomonas sp. 2FE TaxID=2502190 RepID=UPI0010F6A59D|nr:hypothetical protein [Pseudomonas sp. 2FE]